MSHSITIDSEKFEQASTILNAMAAQLCWMSMCHDSEGEHTTPAGHIVSAAFGGFEEQARQAYKLLNG